MPTEHEEPTHTQPDKMMGPYRRGHEDERDVLPHRAEWFRQRWGDELRPLREDTRQELKPSPLEGKLPSASWVTIGPSNVHGAITALAIDPTHPRVLYAGAANGGVWKSTDAGATWRATMQNELSMAVGALGIAPSAPRTVYCATGVEQKGAPTAFPGVGVYKTTDAAGHWRLLSPIASERCTAVLVHPTNANTVYVGGDGGLHLSTNGGASWANVRTDHISDARMDPDDPLILYAAVHQDGVYKSVDGGATWASCNHGLPTGASAPWVRLALGRQSSTSNRFLVAKIGNQTDHLYLSRDAGASWSATPQVAVGGHQGFNSYYWTNVVAVDPTNEDVIFAGGYGLERSSDGGTTFTTDPVTYVDHHALVFSPIDHNVCYVATDNGVYKSTDNGVTWRQQSQGLSTAQIYSIGVAQTPPFVLGAATQDDGFWLYTGAGTTWYPTFPFGPEGGFFVVDPSTSANLYCAPFGAGVSRSTDQGAHWSVIMTGITTNTITRPQHLAVSPVDSNHLLCTCALVFSSVDQGNTWTSVLTPPGWATRVAFSLAGHICYAADDKGNVYRSASAGVAGSWAQPYVPPDAPPPGPITALRVDPQNPDLIYIGYGLYFGRVGVATGRVYVSSDGGVHWSDISGTAPHTLPTSPVTALVIDQHNPQYLYAATAIGVFNTPDGGQSWYPLGDGMPRIATTDLALHLPTNTLYASTMGRGAYKRKL